MGSLDYLFGIYMLPLLSNYYRYGTQLEIFLYTTSWEHHFGKVFMPYLSHVKTNIIISTLKKSFSKNRELGTRLFFQILVLYPKNS